MPGHVGGSYRCRTTFYYVGQSTAGCIRCYRSRTNSLVRPPVQNAWVFPLVNSYSFLQHAKTVPEMIRLITTWRSRALALQFQLLTFAHARTQRSTSTAACAFEVAKWSNFVRVVCQDLSHWTQRVRRPWLTSNQRCLRCSSLRWRTAKRKARAHCPGFPLCTSPGTSP